MSSNGQPLPVGRSSEPGSVSATIRALAAKLGWLERSLFLLLLLYATLLLWRPGSIAVSLLALAAIAAAFLVLMRIARRGMHQLIWRLRNRLIVAYLLIAVVPVLLIMLLALITSYAVIGQVAVYLVNSELNRRVNGLVGQATALAHTTPGNREEMVNRIAGMVSTRFPDFELLIDGKQPYHYPGDSELQAPPKEWKDASGLVLRDRLMHAWAHVRVDGTDVTIVAPLTHDLLTSLVPGLGEVNFLRYYDRGGLDKVPPQTNGADRQVTMLYPLPAAEWESPATVRENALIVTTRPSAVLGLVFGQRFNWGETMAGAFLAVLILFMIVEVLALMTGVKLSRTITGAVHELYEGTERVKEGDFSHRIPVSGTDQLAELGVSFNTMTQNLAQLIVVAKEKERLQSELEIAREVQGQLFPKNTPRMRGLEITGVCHPARMVSGDYYDFFALSEGALAFAIGDVAGKGISAALLMAAIQSTMRTQLTVGVPMAATAGGRTALAHISTAEVVSQLNRQLYATTSPEKYATFFFGLYDDIAHELTYTNAGHLPPLVMRANGIETLEVTGTVVGAFPSVPYEERTVRLDPGDILVTYTDGVVEPENVYGEMFGEDRLKELLVKHARASGPEMIARVMESVQEFTGDSEQFDDMTMVVARRV